MGKSFVLHSCSAAVRKGKGHVVSLSSPLCYVQVDGFSVCDNNEKKNKKTKQKLIHFPFPPDPATTPAVTPTEPHPITSAGASPRLWELGRESCEPGRRQWPWPLRACLNGPHKRPFPFQTASGSRSLNSQGCLVLVVILFFFSSPLRSVLPGFGLHGTVHRRGWVIWERIF